MRQRVGYYSICPGTSWRHFSSRSSSAEVIFGKQKNSKATNLLKNTGILAIGNFSSKVLVFLLVPFYTAVLTTEEYGAYDIVLSTCTLLTPILTLNISDAMLRFPLEEGADIPRIARMGIGVTFMSGLIVLIGQLIPGAPWDGLAGSGFIALLYFSNSFYQLLIVLARGVERFRDAAVAGVLSAATVVCLNIVFLLLLGWGLSGFFVANIAGMLVPALYLLFCMRSIISGPASTRGCRLLVKMVRYSIPLGMTVIGWWMITTSGRYVVLGFCGMEANGLYSVAGKIPAILTTVAGIFLQAWQVSAVKDFDPLDEDGFLLGVFNRVEACLVLTCSLLIIATPLIAKVLFQGEFYGAWVYVPFLLVYVVLNTMGGMWAPFFLAHYDAAPIVASTALGGTMNIVACLLLVPVLGIQGAAVAGLFSGLTNWAWRGIKVKEHIKADFHLRQSLISYGVLCAQAGVMIAGLPLAVSVGAELALFSLLLFRHRKTFPEGMAALKKTKER